MNPKMDLWIRRNWPAITAVAVFALFAAVHQLWFRPVAVRYSRVLKQAIEIGMPLDPNQMPRMMPPRLFARVADNSLPESRAQEAASSGQLTAEFLGDLTQHLSHRSLTVVGTEPAPTTTGTHTVQLRVHVRARGRYSDFVMFLDDLAQDQRLYSISRFNLSPDGAGGVLIDLWASRLVLMSGKAS